ncbi:hypothetical protein [Neisseria montereyensis]|uniref:DUF4124 domain-containing protein n=1 Tax=Neisseria montereyensis TaxID=2973938 RepID=A0ABT2FCS9_9NEIS|nr:hypothetical protein [Neisseria montereyensis]MCS4533905.1 hypothetical protein [Neisseria montereyensis]
MKPLLYCMALGIGLSAPLPAHAVTYICKDGNRAVFSTEKLNASCQPSQMSGSDRNAPKSVSSEDTTVIESTAPKKPSNSPAAKNSGMPKKVSPPATAAPQAFEAHEMDDIFKTIPPIPNDDIKIAPSTPNTSITNTIDAASQDMEIKLRNEKQKRRAPVIVVPKISTPPAEQQLSRQQIIKNEIRDQQSALTKTRAQLNAARKKGDKAKINSLQLDILDYEASIKAMQFEMTH